MRLRQPFVAVLALVLALPAAANAQYPCLGDFSGNLRETPNAKKLQFGMYPGGSAGQVGPVGLPANPEDAAKREAALAKLRPATSDAAPRKFVIHLYRHVTDDREAWLAQEKEAECRGRSLHGAGVRGGA